MARQKSVPIAFTLASDAVHYVYGTAYGAHKACMEKIAADIAVGFKEHRVAVVSIWMGPLLTDRLKAVIASDPRKYCHLEKTREGPEFTGHILWCLYRDPNVMEMSGLTVIGAELAVTYGIKDVDGRQPQRYRDRTTCNHGCTTHM